MIQHRHLLTGFAALALIGLLSFQNCGSFLSAGAHSNDGNLNVSAQSTRANPTIFTQLNAESDLAADWYTAFNAPSKWTTTLSKTDVVQIWEYDIPAFSVSSIQILVAMAANRGQLLSVEMQPIDDNACANMAGAPVDQKIAAAAKFTATNVIANLKPIYDAGGAITYAALDSDGISTSIGPASNCQFSVPQAIQAQISFMQQVHAVYPAIQFGLLPNFPNYNYNGTNCYWAASTAAACSVFRHNDYADVLSEQVQDIRAAGEEVYFVHVDNPYTYTSNHFGNVDVYNDRLIPLRKQVLSYGLRFGIIVNTDLGDGPSRPALDQRYHDESLAYVDDLVASGFGRDDDFIVESWYTYPTMIQPETTVNTFTYTANDVITHFKKISGDTAPDNHIGSGTAATAAAPVASAAVGPISYANIDENIQIVCDYFNPDAIKSLSTQTIQWLATIQPSGLTLHEQYMVARQQGYEGAFGGGQHNAYLAADPTRQAAFTAAVATFANTPDAPWATVIDHNAARRAAGYQGVFECGGDICYQQGACDNLGRRL